MAQKTRLLTLSFVLVAVSASAAVLPSLEASFGEAVHALHAVRPAAFSNGQTEEQLLQLLDDQNINVRASAAKALRDYVQDDKVSKRLIELVENGWENVYVRREAIKTLSYVADRNRDVRDELIKAANEQSWGPVVRSIACKALFASLYPTNPSSEARDTLQRLLADTSEHPDVRAGAAWGLFPDAEQNRGTQDALLAAAKDQWAGENIRVEALRSLYFTLPQRRDVEADVRSLADEQMTPVNVRVAAVLIHQGMKDQNDTARWLADLATNASPDQVRSAAITAQSDLTLDLARWFHFTTLNRRWLDPIAGE